MTKIVPHIDMLVDEIITIEPRAAMSFTPTRLGVKAWENTENQLALVLMIERQDNRGRSIANNSEAIATELLKRLALSTTCTTWIEQFPYSWDDIGHYYLCQYDWHNGVAHNRVGKRIEAAEVEQLIRLQTCSDCGRGPELRVGGCPTCTP